MAKKKAKFNQNHKRTQQLSTFRQELLASSTLDSQEYNVFSRLSVYRNKTSPSESINAFRNFLSMTEAQEIMQYRYSSTDLNINSTTHLKRHNSTTVNDELLWLMEIIKFFSSNINEYVKLKLEYEKLFLEGNYSPALDVILKIEELTGISQWSINCKLCLYFYQENQEEYNKLTQSFSTIESSISKTILTYDGIKSSKSITAERYRFSIGKMIEEVKVDGYLDMVDAIKFRHDFNPSDKYSDLQKIIKGNSEKAYIDMYHLFIKILSYQYAHELNNTDIHSKLINLTTIIDDRNLKVLVDKLTNKYTFDDIDTLHYQTSISYFQNDFKKTIELSENLLDKAPFMSCFYESYVKSLINTNQLNTRYKGPLGQILDLLIRIFTESELNKSLKNLDKIQLILNHHQWSYYLSAIKEKFNGDHSLYLIGLYEYNDTTLLRKSIFSFKRPKENSLLTKINKIEISTWRKNKILADYSFFNGDYEKALSLYTKLDKVDNSYINNEIDSKILQSNHFLGNVHETLEMFTQMILSGANVKFLPISPIAKQIAINCHYKEDVDSLLHEALILSKYNKIISNEYVQEVSNISENILEVLEYERLDQTSIEGIALPIFFFEEILTMDVLEGMTSYINSNIEILQTRVAINKRIIKYYNDPSIINSETAFNETSNIYDKLIMNVCSIEAGQGKVIVNKSSLKTVLYKDVRDELDKIKSLTDREVKNSSFKTDTDGQFEYMNFGTEFHNRINELLHQIAHEYSVNKVYGIDQSLNVGIRHGGLVNLLWAPLKNNDIAAKKSKDGKFFADPLWRQELGYYSDDVLEKIDKSLVTFNEDVNKLIQKYKNRVHINTGEFVNKDKLFNYNISVEFIEEIGEIIDSLNEELIIDKVFTYLDIITSDCLEYARTTFANELEEDYLNCIEKLKTSVNDIDIDFLNKSIAKTRKEISEKIEILIAYFDWLGKSETQFTLGIAIEKAMSVTKELCPWLELQPKVKINSNSLFSGTHFTNIVTVLTLIIENISKHSGAAHTAEYEIIIMEEKDSLQISVINNLYEQLSLLEINEIKSKFEQVNSEFINAATKDSGSGIFKMKKILNHDLNLKTDFIILPTESLFKLVINIVDISSLRIKNENIDC